MDPPSDRALLAALNARPGLSRAGVCRLGSELAAWRDARTPDRELAGRLSIGVDTLSAALDLHRGAEATLRREERRAATFGASVLTLADADFPSELRALSLPPPAVYLAGSLASAAGQASLACLTSPPTPESREAPLMVAIVGSRRASAYGLEVATWLARELARAGVTIVSGFARGIDAAAHRGALKAEGGRTIAVLGCGLAVDYPSGQRPLAREIRERGALLSEFTCDAAPQIWHFPVRNRLIAALARATIVVEAAPRSGSLITARLALEAGKEVLAVPGRVTDELAQGTNELLRDGAAPVLHPDDVLEALGGGARCGAPAARSSPVRTPPRGLTAPLAALYRALDAVAPQSPETLAATTDLPIDQILCALLELELAGHAVRDPGGGYRGR